MILDCSRSMVFGDRIIFINPLESPTIGELIGLVR
jgi:hypothetical protein